MLRTVEIEYLTRSDQTLTEIGGGWDDFALENGAPELLASAVVGRTVNDFVADAETRLIYAALVQRVLRTGEPIRFHYRCDSPGHRRRMAMVIERATPDSVRFRSKLLRNERRPAQRLLDRNAHRSDESLGICGWCNRVKITEDVWEEVEDYVAKSGLMESPALPRLSHGICPRCAAEMEHLSESGS